MGFACRDTSRGVGTTLQPLSLWLFLSLMLITTTLLVLVSSDIFLTFHSLQLMVLMFGGFWALGWYTFASGAAYDGIILFTLYSHVSLSFPCAIL
jgi:hypothetical protein